jgi:predicted permease
MMQTGFRAVPRDFAYSFRMLIKRPWFTLTAVAVLSLGIGANTAVFSLVNAFLLKPLAVANPQELTGVYSRDTKKPDSYRAFSYPNYTDLRATSGVFTGLAAHNLAMVGLAEGDNTRRVFADVISSNYFQTLGKPLWRGRAFTSDEERPGSALPVAIASYSFWKKNSAASDVLGRTLRVNGRLVTVVGIAAEGFTGTTAMISPELYLPLGMYEAMVNDFDNAIRPLAARDNHCLIVVGRLRPGITQQTADRQLAAVADSMAQSFPAENRDQSLIVRPLARLSVGTSPSNDSGLMIPATLLLCMASVVLLIAALNVANMMLARGTARRKEIAIRLALGGGRSSIVQQLFLEGLLLALVGGVAGLFFSYGGTTLLVQSMSRLAPIDLVAPAGPDIRVLAATMAFCLLSTLLFGFVPAWNLSRPNLVSDLRSSDNADPASGKRRLFSRRNFLVIAQVSLSLMLLTAAGLFIRSASRVAGADPGFRLENRVLVEFDASLAGYDEVRGRQVYAAVLDRLKSMPGVESASLAATVPFGMVSLGRSIQPVGDPGAAQAKPQNCSFNSVGEDYFKTLGIPLLRGRSFQPAEVSAGTRPVAILDKLAASRLWPNGDALGKHIRITGGEAAKGVSDIEVVGVVGNVREHVIGRSEEPHIYTPFGQPYQADMHIHLKTTPMGPDAAARFLGDVRREIRNADSRLPVLGVKSLRSHLEASADYWIIQTGAQLFSLFGGIALLLAVIGLYGVRAYSVARRTREIGIRMALGASSREARQMVLREGIKLMGAGAAIGLLLSLLLGQVLAGLLFQVNGADPLVFSGAVLLLGAVSLLACYFPARRASRIDPMVALRYE